MKINQMWVICLLLCSNRVHKFINILPDLVPFPIRVHKFMEINQMWVISIDVLVALLMNVA